METCCQDTEKSIPNKDKSEPTTTPVPDVVSEYSTLGSPIDATPITPSPIPREITFNHNSCLRHSKYTSDKTEAHNHLPFAISNNDPLPLTSPQFLTKIYFSECFDLASANATNGTVVESFSSIDTILLQQSYANLVGIDTRRTPSKKDQMKNKNFETY